MADFQENNQNTFQTANTIILDSKQNRELSGEYRVVGRCGTGGCAIVNEGYRISDNRHVAIKILSLPAGLEFDEAERTRLRFYREAQLMASMKSPYIVECLAYGLFEGKPCMVLEFMNGVQLDEYLKNNGAMSFEQAVDVACQVLTGLGVAHKIGVIHRDIKPANIMVMNGTKSTEIRVYDFGIATVLDDGPGDLMRTQVGSIRGTPSYMAPELFSGEIRACPATDIYAVGLMLHECLTGTVAVMGTSLIQISYKQMHEPLEIPLFIPECLANVIHKCCAKKVEDRYQTTDEVIQALQAVLPEAKQERVSCEVKYLEAIRQKGEASENADKNKAITITKPVLLGVIAGVFLCIALIVVLTLTLSDDESPAPQPFGENSQNADAAAEAAQPPPADTKPAVPPEPEVKPAEPSPGTANPLANDSNANTQEQAIQKANSDASGTSKKNQKRSSKKSSRHKSETIVPNFD